jgi:uracil-DNA glycosylase
VEPADPQAVCRKLSLLRESDRLLGLKDWPVRRDCLQHASMASAAGVHGDPSVVARQTSKSTAASAARPRTDAQPAAAGDPDLDARLKVVIQAFPPELDEPPGADPANRPDPMFSARYALKGSPVDVVKLKAEALAQQAERVKQCKQCGLYKVSTQSVFGVGHPDTRIVFVGEAPGAEEDRTGYPFVGRAGQLLTAMIEKGMGLRREHVYICNVVKHRPPENRTPATDEIAPCQDHLWRQLSVLEPDIVVALGAPATQTLLGMKSSLGSVRGQAFELHLSGSDLAGGPVAKCVPTYHPAYLLRNPADKKKAWEDLQKVMALMNIPTRG